MSGPPSRMPSLTSSLLAALLEAVPDPTLAVAGEVVVAASPSVADLLGRTPEELAGHPVEQVLPRGWATPGAAVARHRDGRDVAVGLSTRALDLDGRPATLVALRPVAPVVASEPAAGSEGMLEALLANAPLVVFIKDRDGRYLMASREFARVLGHPVEHVVGRTIAELAPDLAEIVQANDRAVLATGGPMELELVLPVEGEERVYLAHYFALVDDDGAPRAVCGIATDITERLRAQEEREVLQASLEQAQRLESVGQLAGGIAHDFNNLLAVIGSYAGFIAAAAPEGGEIRQDVDQILLATRQASELTRRLLLFSRREVADPELLDASAVVRDVTELLRRTVGEHIELRVDANARGFVEMDRGQLEQVVMNLAINARDALLGGGSLAVETADADGPDGPRVRISVVDDGCGMIEAVAQHAFEPFFTTKPVGEGTGLGLSTVYGIVAGAGGTVDLQSSAGRGTRVHVVLPAVAPPAPVAGDAQRCAGWRGAGETVLLVEDEPAVRSSTRRILAGHGYHVLEAADGEEALRVAAGADARIDALVTDMVMPRMSGRQLAERLVAGRPGLAVVLMSGYAGGGPEQGGGAPARVAFVEKPFAAERLLEAVRTELDRGARGSAG